MKSPPPPQLRRTQFVSQGQICFLVLNWWNFILLIETWKAQRPIVGLHTVYMLTLRKPHGCRLEYPLQQKDSSWICDDFQDPCLVSAQVHLVEKSWVVLPISLLLRHLPTMCSPSSLDLQNMKYRYTVFKPFWANYVWRFLEGIPLQSPPSKGIPNRRFVWLFLWSQEVRCNQTAQVTIGIGLGILNPWTILLGCPRELVKG